MSYAFKPKAGYNNFNDRTYNFGTIKVFMKLKEKRSKKGKDYSIFEGYQETGSNNRIIKASTFGTVKGSDSDMIVVELTSFSKNSRSSKANPRLKMFLKKKTKISKNGDEYEIFSGAEDMGAGVFCSAKTFGETKNDDLIVIELKEFKPNRNIFK